MVWTSSPILKEKKEELSVWIGSEFLGFFTERFCNMTAKNSSSLGYLQTASCRPSSILNPDWFNRPSVTHHCVGGRGEEPASCYGAVATLLSSAVHQWWVDVAAARRRLSPSVKRFVKRWSGGAVAGLISSRKASYQDDKLLSLTRWPFLPCTAGLCLK